jgi:hypothetical protein
MANGANSYVTNATFTNGQITLTIRVDDFKSGGYVEITGQATQTGGAIAPYSRVVAVPTEPTIPPDPKIAGDTGHYDVTVTATPMKKYQFWPTEEITVVTRVARVWLTVLGPPASDPSGSAGQTDPGQSGSMTWNQPKAVTQETDGSDYGGGSGPAANAS